MSDNATSPDGTADPVLLQKLRHHFRSDPATLPVLEQSFAFYERPNLHLALQEAIGEANRQAEFVGVVVVEDYSRPSLARLSRAASAQHFDEGPVEYVDEPLPGDKNLACVKSALCLVQDDARPLAVLVTEQQHSWPTGLLVEVMAGDRDLAERFMRQLTRLTRHGKAYRGHVLSLEMDCYGGLQVHFHRLPSISRQ